MMCPRPMQSLEPPEASTLRDERPGDSCTSDREGALLAASPSFMRWMLLIISLSVLTHKKGCSVRDGRLRDESLMNMHHTDTVQSITNTATALIHCLREIPSQLLFDSVSLDAPQSSIPGPGSEP